MVDFKDDEFARQVLIEMQEATGTALATLAAAVGDVVGREPLHAALRQHQASVQRAGPRPMLDLLLAKMQQALKPKH